MASTALKLQPMQLAQVRSTTDRSVSQTSAKPYGRAASSKAASLQAVPQRQQATPATSTTPPTSTAAPSHAATARLGSRSAKASPKAPTQPAQQAATSPA